MNYRPVNEEELNTKNEMNDKITKRKETVRRSKSGKKKDCVLSIMYSNIQGITKKKESLTDIMNEIDCDVCLLAETMTNKVKIAGCRCITSRNSVGQNVCIILRKNIMNERILKLYEQNDIVNMIGIRVELMNTGLSGPPFLLMDNRQADDVWGNKWKNSCMW